MDTSPPSRSDSFETVDWQDTGGTGNLRWQIWGFLAGLGVLVFAYLYETVGPGLTAAGVTLKPLDWLTAIALLALVVFVVVPLARNPETTRRYWERLRSNRLGVLSLAYVAVFFLVGLVGPVLVSEVRLNLLAAYQPPVGTTVEMQFVTSCVGDATGGMCPGTWRYPLGTTYDGKSLVPIVVYGARTTLQVVLVSALLFVPTGVAVGLIAAYAGDMVDAVLMRLAETLQTIPAILIYLIVFPWTVDYRLLTMVAVFGLASWGGLARLVRNRTLELRERQYVKAAELAGASRKQVVQSHLLPNISGSVLTNATLQAPMLVLTAAAISFLNVGPPAETLGDPSVHSWGQTIFLGIQVEGTHPAWWITVVPSVLLVVTVVAFNVLGDALRDALDPREAY